MEKLTIKELETLLEAVRRHGADKQILKAVEELGELTQALCKYQVEGWDADHVAEEMADVSIMLEQLKIIFNNHVRVDAWAHEKLARLSARLEKEADAACQ